MRSSKALPESTEGEGEQDSSDYSERVPTQVSMAKYLHKVSLWLPKNIRKNKQVFSFYRGHQQDRTINSVIQN